MLIRNDTYIFINRSFGAFNFQDLLIFINPNGEEERLVDFECAYTFGGVFTGTYSHYKHVDNMPYVNYNIPVHVSFFIKKRPTPYHLLSIFYQGEEISFSDIKFETVYPSYSKEPLFDALANQRIPIDNWKRQCVAINQMYGVEVIYFKVDPTQTINTLANNFLRQVVCTKRMKVMFPGGAMPEDQQQFTEWDIILPSDFTIHIIKDVFTTTFGDNTIPNEKDIMFIPLLNRMFRVMTIQNTNKYLGQSAWWEAFLQKYEEDASVKMDDIILSTRLEVGDIDITLDSYIQASTKSQDRVDEATVDEINTATERMNVLKDTTHLISLKETELLREFYHERLEIISIRIHPQSTRLFNVYNLTLVDTSAIGLVYNTDNYLTKNRHINVVSSGFRLSFDFTIREVMTSIQDEIPVQLMTIYEHDNQEIIEYPVSWFGYQFEESLIYNVDISYSTETNTYDLNIYHYDRFKMNIVYHDIKDNVVPQPAAPKQAIDLRPNLSNHTIGNLILLGGHYYIGHVKLTINNENIIEDNCRPILVLNPHKL
jgi:hypothetical protein